MTHNNGAPGGAVALRVGSRELSIRRDTSARRRIRVGIYCYANAALSGQACERHAKRSRLM